MHVELHKRNIKKLFMKGISRSYTNGVTIVIFQSDDKLIIVNKHKINQF